MRCAIATQLLAYPSLGEGEALVVVDGLKVRAQKLSFYKNDRLHGHSEMPPVRESSVLRTPPIYRAPRPSTRSGASYAY